MAILHSARGAVASTSDVQFISVGYGQGSATTVDYQKSGLYYPIFMGWAGQLKGYVTFGAIVIMLGVTDGEHLAAADQSQASRPALPRSFPTFVPTWASPISRFFSATTSRTRRDQYAITGAYGTVMVPLVQASCRA
jgi:hypothetical protein